MLGVVGTSACVSGADVALPHPPAAHSIGYGAAELLRSTLGKGGRLNTTGNGLISSEDPFRTGKHHSKFDM